MKTKKTKAAKQVVFSVGEPESQSQCLSELRTGESAIDENGVLFMRTDEGYLWVDEGYHYQNDFSYGISGRKIKQFIGRLKFSVVE